jgi:hypothetical protein
LEPKAEVVRAERTAAPEKAFASTRSPRKLALMAQDSAGNAVCLLAQIETRQFVDRNLFVTHKPDPDLQLFDDALKLLAIWMSRRYRRPELPTALQNRFGKKFGKLKELGQKSGAMFSRMFISIRPWDELPANQNYQVKILALLPAAQNHLADEDSVPPEAKNWAIAADLLLEGVEGVEAELTEVKSESAVSIATVRQYRIFDLDFVSFDAGEFDLTADE